MASVFEIKHNAVLNYQLTTNYSLQTVQPTEKIYVIPYIPYQSENISIKTSQMFFWGGGCGDGRGGIGH